MFARLWLLLAISATSFPASAQHGSGGTGWTRSEGPYGGPVRDLSARADGTLLAATPTGPFVIGARDSAWTRLEPTVPDGAGSALDDLLRFIDVSEVSRVRFLSDGRVLLGGLQWVLGRDGGASWRVLDGGDDHEPTFSNLLEVQARDGALYAVGRPGVARSDDGGASWQSLLRSGDDRQLGTEAGHQGMVVLPDGVLLAMASGWTDDGGVRWEQLRSEDGGSTWEPARPPTVPLSMVVRPDGVVDLVGRAGTFEEPSYESLSRYLSDDGGRTWTPALPPPDFDYQLALGSDGVLYAFWERLHRWDGSAWETLTDDALTPDDLVSAFVAVGDTLYLGLDRGVVRSVDGGETWAPHDAGLAGPATPVAEDRLLLGDDGHHLAITTDNRLYVTADDGQSWQPVGRDDVVALGEGPGPVVGVGAVDPSRVGVFQRAAGGAWAPVDTLRYSGSAVARGLSGHVAFCADAGPAVLGPDGEARRLPLAGPYNACWAVGDGLLIVVDGDRLTRSEGGQDPVEVDVAWAGSDGAFDLREVVASGDAVLARTSASLYRSADGGRSWSVLPTTGLPEEAPDGFAARIRLASLTGRPGGGAYVATEGGGLFRWEEARAAWAPVGVGLPAGRATSIRLLPSGHLLADTPDGLHGTDAPVE